VSVRSPKHCGPVVAVACACALGLACEGSSGEEVTSRESAAITNGFADSGDPAVVAIVGAPGTEQCSGTVISPYVVLTAGHCTVPDIVQGGSVVFGSSLTAPTSSIPIALAVAHPQFDPGSLANDIGLLVLASTAPATSVPLGTSAPAVSDTVDIVGWGLTTQDAGDGGQKRQGSATVTTVDTMTFGVGPLPSQPCEGDSGGPALATITGVESVVGVTSHGDAACVQGATYTRVDAYIASFIQPTMAQYGPGTAAPGARCLFPAQCDGGASACLVAADDPNLGYCSTSCQHDSDCPSAMTCDGSQCRYPLPTPGTYGAPCSSDANCVEGECTTTDVCALRCVPGTTSCPAGFSCINTSEIDFFCIASPPTAKKGSSCAMAAPDAGGKGPVLGALLALGLLAARAQGARRRHGR
jgi:hypothetical protein